MKHLQLFETYKAQKEIEILANLCIKKVCEETFRWNKDFIWTEPREGDYGAMENKQYRVSFKGKTQGFTEGAIYTINKMNGLFMTFKGYNRKFEHSEVELTWSETNANIFKQFIKTNIKSAARDKMDEFDELKGFIENTHVTYELVESNNSRDKGQLSSTDKEHTHSKVTIFYNNDVLLELGRDKRKTTGEYTDSDIYFSLYNDLISTSIHELQHAYDGYRSKGKSFNKQTKDFTEKSHKANIIRDKENLEQEERDFLNSLSDEYLNFPHEINARFTQAIQDMTFAKVEYVNGDNLIFKMYSLQDVVNSFKLHFRGYKVLSVKNRKALIRKLSQFWHLEKDRVDAKNLKRLG